MVNGKWIKPVLTIYHSPFTISYLFTIHDSRFTNHSFLLLAREGGNINAISRLLRREFRARVALAEGLLRAV
jgi:hypothetical protein